MSSIIQGVRQLAGKHRDEFTGGGWGAHTLRPGQMGCGGGAIFMIKQKNMRNTRYSDDMSYSI